MCIPSSILPDLDWRSRAMLQPINAIKQNEFCLEIYSDTSTKGWGIACNGERASGMRSDSEQII